MAKSNGEPLLPQLRRLQFYVSLTNPTGLLLFLSPTITYLRLYLISHVRVEVLQLDRSSVGSTPRATSVVPSTKSELSVLTQGFIQLVIPQVPRVVFLEIGGLDIRVPSSTFSSLSSLDGVKDLRLGLPLDTHGLHALSHMRSLTSLTIRLIGIEDEPTSFFGDGFRNVTVLWLAGSITSCSRMLKMASFPSLRTAEFQADPINDTDSFQQAFADICASLPPQSLECISLTTVPRKQGGRFNVLFTPLLEALKSLISLNDFTLDFEEDTRTMIHVSDEDIKAVAATWPNIVKFYVSVSPHIQLNERSFDRSNGGHFPLPSLYSLLVIARHCPELHHLNIPAIALPQRHPSNNNDAAPFNTLASDLISLARVSPKNDRLKSLWVDHLVGDTTYRSLLAVALLFDTLFPNLGIPDAAARDELASTSISKWFTDVSYTDMSEIASTLLVSIRAGRKGGFQVSLP